MESSIASQKSVSLTLKCNHIIAIIVIFSKEKDY